MSIEIENLLKAREQLKLGNVPQVEMLEPTGKHQSFQLWSDFKTGTEKLLSDQTFHGFKLLLPSERGRVSRSESSFGCEPAGYLALVKTCFGKFANYIDVLTFNLAHRLVPWPQWVRLSDDCFNFCSEMTDKQRKISLEELKHEKVGPVPQMNDEKLAFMLNTLHYWFTLRNFVKPLHLIQQRGILVQAQF